LENNVWISNNKKYRFCQRVLVQNIQIFISVMDNHEINALNYCFVGDLIKNKKATQIIEI
jgi:hypothetical protein